MFEFTSARQGAAARRAGQRASRNTRLFLESLEDRRLLASDPNVRLIDSGDVWKYLDDGSDQGTAWRAIAFDDSAWASGPSELGYGDGDEATVVGFGPDSGNKYATTYFRRKFQVNSPNQIGVLTASIKRDDGIAVYLNGDEVIRDTYLAGNAAYNTYCGAVPDENARVSWSVDPAKLVAGENTIAIEVHQTGGGSSDISLDVQLIAGRTKFVVTNTADSGTGSLRQAIADCAGNPGVAHVVSFEIPGGGTQQIVLNSPLLNLTDPVTYTVPAGTEVQVGTNAANATSLGQCGNTTKAGGGMLTVGGNFNRTINTTLKVDGGTLRILSNPNPSGTLRTTINANAGGMVEFGADQSLLALNVNAGGKAAMLPNGSRVLLTNALSISTATDPPNPPTGQLDLGNNDLIVQATAATRAAVYANLSKWIAAGANNLNWNGQGITSSSAATDPSLLTAVGVMLNDNGQGGAFYTTFSGKTVNVNSVLAKYTYYGDADLSGVVDGTDYALADNGFNAVLSGWFNGDFNYEAPVDGNDYPLIDNAFNAQGPPLAAGGGLAGVPAAPLPSQGPTVADRPTAVNPAAVAAAIGDWTFALDDGFGAPTRRRR